MSENPQIQGCLARVAARGSISQAEAEQILNEVYDRAEQARATGDADPYGKAAGDLSASLKERAAADHADALRNAAKRAAIIEPITAGGIAKAADRLRSLLYWTPGNEAKQNIQTFGRALTHDWSSQAWFGLKKAGVLKAAASKDFFRDIAREYWAMNAGEAGAKTSTSAARKIAEAFAPIADNVRDRLNAEGARIGDAKDYAGNTSHDPFWIRRGGRDQPREMDANAAFAKWWAWTQPRLAEKTFADLESDMAKGGGSREALEQKFGRSVWEALVTGIRKPEPGTEDTPSFGTSFEGSRNLARKISEGRVLFWKDADAWVDYMQRYGKPTNFYEMMIRQFEGAGRQASLMHFLGTNPAGNFDLIQRRIAQHFRSDVDGVDKFGRDIRSSLTQPDINVVMSHLDGSALMPANEAWAQIGSTVRQFYDMEYLGSVGITHATSTLATFPTQGRHFGIGTLQSIGHLINAVVPDWLKGEERNDALAQLGAYGEGATRKAFNSFGHGYNVPGVVAATHSKFMEATGINYWLDHTKNGMKEVYANQLARLRGLLFGQLDQHIQNGLNSYGIGPKDWDILRSVEPLKTSTRSYITPHHAFDADAGQVESVLRDRGVIDDKSSPGQVQKQIASYRQNMADNLAMMMQDAADHSTVTGGVRERVMFHGKAEAGTFKDEFLSAALMFKTWPLAAMHQMMGREIYQSLSKTEMAGNVMTLVGLSMLGGYIRMTVGDLAAGRQYRVPKNAGDAAKIAMASLAQGGGLGIFGDMLFGEANRFGASNLSSFGGPMLTDFSQLDNIYNRWIQSIGTSSQHDFWPELARFGINHIPMQNLFYVKATMDYALWYHVFETLHPGWWARTNQRMQRETGRTMMGYRPGAPIPYLPPYMQSLSATMH